MTGEKRVITGFVAAKLAPAILAMLWFVVASRLPAITFCQAQISRRDACAFQSSGSPHASSYTLPRTKGLESVRLRRTKGSGSDATA